MMHRYFVVLTWRVSLAFADIIKLQSRWPGRGVGKTECIRRMKAACETRRGDT
jgi:hypothetical protein